MSFLEKQINYIKANYSDIVAQVQTQVDRSFGSIRYETVDMILISFMNTSLYFGKPNVRLSFYKEEDVWERPLLETEFGVDWLFHEWGYHSNSEEELQSKRVYLKPILIYASGIFKYALARCDKFQNYALLKRAEEFYICFGEYKDWQMPIYIEKREIDIFQNLNQESLEFRRFHHKIYQKKEFVEFKLDNSRFTDCKFTDCSFSGTELNDVMFERCTFENVQFINCTFWGSTFEFCDFHSVKAEDSIFTYKKEEGKPLSGIYKNSNFLQCNMEEFEFGLCDMSGVVIE